MKNKIDTIIEVWFLAVFGFYAVLSTLVALALIATFITKSVLAA